MQCSNCQIENRSGARFCAACGRPLGGAEPIQDASSEAMEDLRASHRLAREPAPGPPAEPVEVVSTATDQMPAACEGTATQPDPATLRLAEDQAAPKTGVDLDKPMPADGGQAREAADAAVQVDSGPAAADSSSSERREREETLQPVEEAAIRETPTRSSTLEPLPVGTLLLNRYEILEFVSSAAEGNVYLARDLRRCPVCGFDNNAPSPAGAADAYCAECGASLAAAPTCEVWEQPATLGSGWAEPQARQRADRFEAGSRRYVIVAASDATEREPDDATYTEDAPASTIDLRWAVRTHAGRVRALNEDAVDVHVYGAEGGVSVPDRTLLGLFVVADGVGGQAAGEVASRLAVDTIWARLRQTVWVPELEGDPVLPETMVIRVKEAISSANEVVYQERTQVGSDMGTTITLALVRDRTAVIANVGDSRIYRWNADGLERLTQDHSLVQSLVDAGEVESDSVYTHPQRNVIYRSIGDRPRVEVDTAVHELSPGDRLVLCSDGLWEMARDEGIEETLLREPDPKAATEALVHLANLAGGTDNISAVVVEIVEA